MIYGFQKVDNKLVELESYKEASWVCLYPPFDHGELDDDGADQNDQEELVVEEVLEDVVLVGFELPGVDFVEDLKEHENVEENGLMFAGLIIPFTHTNR